MHRSIRPALAAAASGAALLALPACGDWTVGPQAPSGTIVSLEERPAFETDCTVDDPDEPSCTIEYEADCNLVVFEDADGLQFSDCIGQTAWSKLKVGDAYTDRED